MTKLWVTIMILQKAPLDITQHCHLLDDRGCLFQLQVDFTSKQYVYIYLRSVYRIQQ